MAVLSHDTFLTGFDRGLRGGPMPPGVTARIPAEAARRFDVYRNNVAVSLTEALASRFPVIRRLVGDEFFRAMARVFAEAHRPQSPVLAEWGDSFPDFLAGFPPLADWPYMADVARIEYARGVAFHAADAEPLDPQLLTGADPETLILHLHPSLQVLASDHAAVSVWQQNQPGAQAGPLPAAPETALILRDRAHEVPVHSIGPGDVAMLAAIQSGATLVASAEAGLAADPAHQAQALLVHLMLAGAIVMRRGHLP